MKSIKSLIITLTISFLLILSCTDSTEPDETAKISGNVTNSLGEPVPNSKIMLTYYTESIPLRPETTFSFNLTDSTHVKLWITHHELSDTVKVIVDDYLSPGNHSFTWNSTNSEDLFIVNNFYDWHLIQGHFRIDDKLLLNKPYINITGVDVNNYESFATTDDNGHYEFEIDRLPFSFADNEIEVKDENGVVIDTVRVSRTVKICALHTDYNPAFNDSVYINEDSVTEGNLSFD